MNKEHTIPTAKRLELGNLSSPPHLSHLAYFNAMSKVLSSVRM